MARSPPMVSASMARATLLDAVPLAHELLALLDHGFRQRLGEFALRQDEFVGLAGAGLPGLVAREQASCAP